MEIIAEKNIHINNAEYILRLARHPRAGLLVLVGQPASTRLMPNAIPGEFIRCADFAVTVENTLGKGSGLVAQNAEIRAAAAAFITETLND
jgi:hypothetical protein